MRAFYRHPAAGSFLRRFCQPLGQSLRLLGRDPVCFMSHLDQSICHCVVRPSQFKRSPATTISWRKHRTGAPRVLQVRFSRLKQTRTIALSNTQSNCYHQALHHGGETHRGATENDDSARSVLSFRLSFSYRGTLHIIRSFVWFLRVGVETCNVYWVKQCQMADCSWLPLPKTAMQSTPPHLQLANNGHRPSSATPSMTSGKCLRIHSPSRLAASDAPLPWCADDVPQVLHFGSVNGVATPLLASRENAYYHSQRYQSLLLSSYHPFASLHLSSFLRREESGELALAITTG